MSTTNASIVTSSKKSTAYETIYQIDPHAMILVPVTQPLYGFNHHTVLRRKYVRVVKGNKQHSIT